MKTQNQLSEERHAKRLAAVQEQLDSGSLIVRQMTAKERAANPPRPRPKRKGGRKRSYRWAH